MRVDDSQDVRAECPVIAAVDHSKRDTAARRELELEIVGRRIADHDLLDDVTVAIFLRGDLIRAAGDIVEKKRSGRIGEGRARAEESLAALDLHLRIGKGLSGGGIDDAAANRRGLDIDVVRTRALNLIRRAVRAGAVDVDHADVVGAVIESGDLVVAVRVGRAAGLRLRLRVARCEHDHDVRERLRREKAVLAITADHRVGLELNVDLDRRPGVDLDGLHCRCLAAAADAATGARGNADRSRRRAFHPETSAAVDFRGRAAVRAVCHDCCVLELRRGQARDLTDDRAAHFHHDARGSAGRDVEVAQHAAGEPRLRCRDRVVAWSETVDLEVAVAVGPASAAESCFTCRVGAHRCVGDRRAAFRQHSSGQRESGRKLNVEPCFAAGKRDRLVDR